MLLTCVYHSIIFYLCLFVIWCLKMFEMCWSSWKVGKWKTVAESSESHFWPGTMEAAPGQSEHLHEKCLAHGLLWDKELRKMGKLLVSVKSSKPCKVSTYQKKMYKPVTITRLCSMKGWILGTKESIWSHLAGSCNWIKNIAQFPGPVGRASHLFVHARISPINKM